MEFDNIFELLESVRTYELRSRESLVPLTNVTGTSWGYSTADSAFPALTWTIPARVAKQTALARGTREGLRIHELLVSHMGRRQLLEELREGRLEYGIARRVEPQAPPPKPTEALNGPRQLQLPL